MKLQSPRFFLFFELLFCLLCVQVQSLSAAEPANPIKAVVTGPKEAALGDLVILDASQSSGQAYRWILVNSQKTFLPVDGGLRVVFASGHPGEFIFVLVVGGHDNNDRLVVTMAEHRVTIDGKPRPKPEPPPPGPNPKPDPNVPEGEFGLTRWAYDNALSKVAAAERAKAVAVGDNFSTVSGQLAAGGYLNLGQANEDLRAKNAATVGAAREVWLPWFEAEAAEMQRLQKENKITTDQHVVAAYKAVGDGLKLVK